MLEVFSLCQAIVAELDSETWIPGITARAAWTVAYEPRDLVDGVLVTAVPDRLRQLEMLSRKRDVRQELSLSLLIQRKVTNTDPETLTPLGALQSSIADHLRRRTIPLQVDDMQFFYQFTANSGLVRRHLEQYRVWTGFLDLTYAMLKS